MKSLTTLLALCFCLSFTTPVHAASDSAIAMQDINQNVILDTITLEYTVVANPLADTESISVTQQITYNGIVTPAASIEWIETVDGADFIGTLYLSSFHHTNEDTTIAIYKGTLYREDSSLY